RAVSGATLSISSGADTRTVSAAASCPLSKLSAAALMIAVPDLMPTTRPASTVATVESLLDQTNTTLGIACESATPVTSQARAATTVSWPLNRMLTGVMLTCTDESCSVGYAHVPTITKLTSSVRPATARLRRMHSSPAEVGVNVITAGVDTQMIHRA